MTATVYVVVEGGCVRYISSTDPEIEVYVLDIDDQRDAPDEDVARLLATSERQVHIW